jgi:hypothetical protein
MRKKDLGWLLGLVLMAAPGARADGAESPSESSSPSESASSSSPNSAAAAEAPATDAPAATEPPAATAEDGQQEDDPPPEFSGLMKTMFASVGPELNLASATGKNGGPYTAQMVLPTLELGTYGPGFYFEGELTSYGLALVPLIAPAPDNDYSWMVPPAAEDPSVHFLKLSLLNLRFGVGLAEFGPVALGFSVHGDARSVVYGVYAGGFDTTSTKMGGTEWTQGAGLHAMWDVVERVRLDVAAMPFFGFDPRTNEFFSSWGGRAFADLSWAVWPDLLAMRASGGYEYLNWIQPAAPGVFHIVTARLSLDVYFDLPG